MDLKDRDDKIVELNELNNYLLEGNDVAMKDIDKKND